MTLDEAKKLADVIAAADMGCSVCVNDLAHRLGRAFPEFRWCLDEDAEWEVDRFPSDDEIAMAADDWGALRSFAPVRTSAAQESDAGPNASLTVAADPLGSGDESPYTTTPSTERRP